MCFAFFATTINYIDRQVLAILAPQLQSEIGWSEIEYGYIVTAFQLSYAVGLLMAGKLIDFLGTKRGFILSIVVWSLAAMSHAWARTATGFGLARLALGIGESGNFPAAIKTIAEWFPQREGFGNGYFQFGLQHRGNRCSLNSAGHCAQLRLAVGLYTDGCAGFCLVIFLGQNLTPSR